MRSIAVEKVNGVPRTVLNGAPVFLMATLDQGFWPDGLHTAPTDQALAYDLKGWGQYDIGRVAEPAKSSAGAATVPCTPRSWTSRVS